jgi:hypothetical protein
MSKLTLTVIIAVALVAAISVSGYLYYQSHTNTVPTDVTAPTDVTFDVSLNPLQGSACVYTTEVGSSSVCFEPTSQQYDQIQAATKGYIRAEMKASAYTDHEVLHNLSLPKNPGEDTTVLHAVKIYSITPLGQPT